MVAADRRSPAGGSTGVSLTRSIALLSHHASRQAPTGAEHSLALLAVGLKERGHRVCIVTPAEWVLAESMRAAGVEVLCIRSTPLWTTYWKPRPWPVAAAKLGALLPSRAASRRLAAFLENWRADIVHVNCLPHLSGAMAATAAGRPCVWHLREILPPGARRRWWSERLRRHASRIVAVSEAVGAWVREEGLGERLTVIPNGAPERAEEGDALSARVAFGLEPDRVWIGLFGQLVPHKGALSFIEAGRLALDSAPQLGFVIAGAGPQEFRDRCAAAIQRTGRADAFRLLPPQPHAAKLMAASDVVCLATTTPDPFPRSVLEAMGACRPVVAFDSGGTREMVLDGECGWLVPCGDVPALAAGFVRLASDGALRARMGQAGQRRVRECFSLERHVRRMESVLVRVGE